MLYLDGSYGEGGGQIVRTALALSTLLGVPFEINHIRKGREKPGLKAEHLACVSALRELCGAAVEGDFLGSERLVFRPKTYKGRTLKVDIGTAGSITLVLQAVLLPAMFGKEKTRLKITGGTDVKWSMPFDYFRFLLMPYLQRYADIEILMNPRGYFPKGQGLVDISITPKHALDLERLEESVELLNEDVAPLRITDRGGLVQVKGSSHASLDLQEAQVAERQAKSAKHALGHLGVPIVVQPSYSRTASIGSGVVLWAVCSLSTDEVSDHYPRFIGGDALGEKGKRAEAVGIEAARSLLSELEQDGAVDSHLADNLIPLIGLLGGDIAVTSITEHTRTNMWVCEQFLGKKFVVDEERKIIRM